MGVLGDDQWMGGGLSRWLMGPQLLEVFGTWRRMKHAEDWAKWLSLAESLAFLIKILGGKTNR